MTLVRRWLRRRPIDRLPAPDDLATEARIQAFTARVRGEDLPLLAAVAALWSLLNLPLVRMLLAWGPGWVGPWA